MVFIDMPRREITLELVYCGPALSGKTTNLLQLHQRMQGHTDGELVTLPGIRSDEEVARIRARDSEPVYTAVALRGDGVPETFLGLASSSWRTLERRHGFEERFGGGHDEVVGQLSRALGGTAA